MENGWTLDKAMSSLATCTDSNLVWCNLAWCLCRGVPRSGVVLCCMSWVAWVKQSHVQQRLSENGHVVCHHLVDVSFIYYQQHDTF